MIYEYTTRNLPTKVGTVRTDIDAEMAPHGWRRVWADITMEQTFVVYRREKMVVSK